MSGMKIREGAFCPVPMGRTRTSIGPAGGQAEEYTIDAVGNAPQDCPALLKNQCAVLFIGVEQFRGNSPDCVRCTQCRRYFQKAKP